MVQRLLADITSTRLCSSYELQRVNIQVQTKFQLSRVVIVGNKILSSLLPEPACVFSGEAASKTVSAFCTSDDIK
jgi:hypothetical protein